MMLGMRRAAATLGIMARAAHKQYYEILQSIKFPKNLSLDTGPWKLKIKSRKVRSKCRDLPLRDHDFIMFQQMTGNEILINLDNAKFLRNTELVSGLSALSKTQGQEKFNWEENMFVEKALNEVCERRQFFNKAQIVGLFKIMDRLKIKDPTIWEILRVKLDKFLPQLTNQEFDIIFKIKDSRNILDENFKETYMKMMPSLVKGWSNEKLVEMFELLVNRGWGSTRLFEEYIYFYIEKRVKRLTLDQYLCCMNLLGEKKYSDPVFWKEHYFTEIYSRNWKLQDLTRILSGLESLKKKCPLIDVDPPLAYVQSLIGNLLNKKDDVEDKKSILPKVEKPEEELERLKKRQMNIKLNNQSKRDTISSIFSESQRISIRQRRMLKKKAVKLNFDLYNSKKDKERLHEEALESLKQDS